MRSEPSKAKTDFFGEVFKRPSKSLIVSRFEAIGAKVLLVMGDIERDGTFLWSLCTRCLYGFAPVAAFLCGKFGHRQV